MSVRLMRHHIFDALREDIMSCGLLPGAEVRESALAEKYGVSKSPIRDALQKLEWEGLVEIAPRQGHRVAPISIQDAQDILDFREILEVSAVRRICADASAEALAALDAYRTCDSDNLRDYAVYNRAFHVCISTLAGNRRQTATVIGLMENYERLCIVSLSSRRDEAAAMSASLTEHVRIIDALQARDARTATRLSISHIRKSQAQVMRGLRNQPVVP
ncbi:DNA-binding transcriptional regulator, GntR family [Loktanella fryxellensis]|uniref:DNA-binding transcriptional regulator, GntR family n=1 Tax=Loktanella fryxellensis TaxID=245187 RepID=A0A1H8C574_9RHOB|nr:GntR family transcriptional regulator [Loktanella fryxellensis]SEM90112.1 DNA-binding transcriptional regulator, GntR family [Loktanella fryxellensis]